MNSGGSGFRLVRNIVTALTSVAGIGLIPYAIAVLMPSWRWLLGVALVTGSVLSAVWFQDWLFPSNFAIGLLAGHIITAAFAAGVAIRALTLLLANRGLSFRYVVLICVAGFAIVPILLLQPVARHEWNMQPPSEACSGATFRVKVANAEFAIPVSPIFTIYRANPGTAHDDANYLSSSADLRTFCGLSKNGKQPVQATNISLRFRGYDIYVPAICAGPVPDIARTYCATDKSARPANIDSLDFPLQIYVFAPDEVTLGHFGGSRSTYEDSLNARPRANGPVFIMAETLAPDEHPLTFECSENGDGYWCKASYAWNDGAFLQYEFRSGRLDVAARGGRVDAEARKFLSGLRTQDQRQVRP
jgi:hypothetical protein